MQQFMQFRCIFSGIVLFGWCLALSGQNTINRCMADQFLTEGMEFNPQTKEHFWNQQEALEELLQNSYFTESRQKIVIPVVVHVVWNNPDQNISDLQIYDQIESLNSAFNQRNRNLHAVSDPFRELISNVGIEFCLAQRDPEGNLTSGITRTNTNIQEIGNERIDFIKRAIHFTDYGGKNLWDTQKYLNIWVCEIGGGILGNATFPNGAPYPEAEGIIIDYRYFGSIGSAAENFPYNGGKTLVHEVGHYFNLFHPWGPGSGSCEVDDFIEDTPLQSGPYFECDDPNPITCDSRDIVTNFMDYAEDICLAMFTFGQKNRMLASINLHRSALIESDACIPPNNHKPEGGIEDFKIYYSQNANRIEVFADQMGEYDLELRLFDMTGRLVQKESVLFSQSTFLNSQNIPSGMYIICFRAAEDQHCKKVLIY